MLFNCKYLCKLYKLSQLSSYLNLKKEEKEKKKCQMRKKISILLTKYMVQTDSFWTELISP